LTAYSLYLNIELRVPQLHVASKLNRLFDFHLGSTNISGFKAGAAENYKGTYDSLVKRVCSGRLLHADETKINVRNKDGFVWVFANMEEVAYVYSETREGDLLRTVLKDFKGVLVSDFYAAYDSIKCPQQKCLIHLIRDLNDDVLKYPYDEDLKQLVLAFAVLLRPMVESIDRYGLKSRFLKKHLPSVKRFYRQMSESNLQSERAAKVKERLEKNRDRLFTFLSYDGVPWNNNNAEHAVKPFAALRQIIGGLTTEKGIQGYLVLLSLCETCRYIGVDFLDFLRSGEKDIHAFADRRRGQRQRFGSDR
jgi:Transposase IS66 family